MSLDQLKDLRIKKTKKGLLSGATIRNIDKHVEFNND
jgi:hypothetical protein